MKHGIDIIGTAFKSGGGDPSVFQALKESDVTVVFPHPLPVPAITILLPGREIRSVPQSEPQIPVSFRLFHT